MCSPSGSFDIICDAAKFRHQLLSVSLDETIALEQHTEKHTVQKRMASVDNWVCQRWDTMFFGIMVRTPRLAAELLARLSLTNFNSENRTCQALNPKP